MTTSRAEATAAASREGFTLLELVIAVSVLATFILPLLQIIADSRVRAIRYTLDRQVRELARQKLHDRIHYYEVEDSGTFDTDGHPNWEWEVDPPEMRGQSEQVILQYTIHVHVPQKLKKESGESGSGTDYEYTTWAFPDSRWYEEQDLIYEQGGYSPLYGSADGLMPAGGGGLPGGY